MRDQRIVIAGAGASAQGIANLIVSALTEDGLSREQAIRRIWTTDSKGLVTLSRPALDDFKKTYARAEEEVAAFKCANRTNITLAETIRNSKPTILIGTSGTPGTFSEEVVAAMAAVNERPIVFPLSNPTSKSECTPEQALRWSAGRAVVATGSPFAPVTVEGKRYRIGQCNNSFIFPGVGLGLTVSRARTVSDGVFLEAAKSLASQVTREDLAECAIYPRLARIRDCSLGVACAAARKVVEEGHSGIDLPENLEQTMQRAMWFPSYLPVRYEP